MKGHALSADILVICPRWKVQAPHLRCILKRALALQATQNIWTGQEDIDNAVEMAYGNQLPDSGQWLLTCSQLHTLKVSIEWRRGGRASSKSKTPTDIIERWIEIEEELMATYRDARHAEGLHWM
jgi:hypothetical protein